MLAQDRQIMAITVKQALTIGGLQQGRLLAGEHHSLEALLARSRSLGWDLSNKRVIMLVG